ncbi:formylglycine-generating enzyme family protein [Fimbriiglobus ruber]|uniref:formylglycine-generating enzyme family protein n=1 Tax=Fimbriiglobus ruber TaxID=1908690 RepID=UPI001EE73816|nr:SUMF1/EgtB/PvdO family nonheme iron enzyme [Fimbriiglobus ruber]
MEAKKPATDGSSLQPATNIAPPLPFAERKSGQTIDCEISPGVKMRFCWIPPGQAVLGSPESEKDRSYNEIEHEYVSRGFWLGKYEVTQGEWTAIMGNNPSKFKEGGQFPAEQASWEDCQDFLAKIDKRFKEKLIAFDSPGKFVLPHEDEWEYACRGGKGTRQPFSFGDVCNGTQSNCNGNFPYGTTFEGRYLGKTAEVGSCEKNYPHPWGLCDMHGNVWEWCENRIQDSKSHRSLRGGSWNGSARHCRAASRGDDEPSDRTSHHGFRVAYHAVAFSSNAQTLPISPIVRAQPFPQTAPDTSTVLPEVGKFKPGQVVEASIAAGVKMKFCWVPPGKAVLGSPLTEAQRQSDETEHEHVSKGFWLGKYEVTQSEWRAVVGSNPSRFRRGNQFPVENVSWSDCQFFLNRLNGNSEIRKAFGDSGKFVLPHENEWEYAWYPFTGSDSRDLRLDF